MNNLIKHFLATSLLLISSVVVAQKNDAIIQTAQVQEAIARGAIIWDVRDEKSYLEGHIPGAINIGDAGNILRDANKEDYIATAKIQAIFNQAGLDVNKDVVVYGSRGNPYAYFGLYTINYFGGKQAQIYHDGIDAWKSAGLPLQKDRAILPAVSVEIGRAHV